MNSHWVRKLKEQLAKSLPGEEAQCRMSPLVRRPVSTERPLKRSGVLILLYPHEEKTHTLFIKRTEYDGVHSGQVSLPGGMFESADITLLNTALRETMEETGVPTDFVEIIGNLTCLHIPVSNIIVFPYVGITEKHPAFQHDPYEVQYLIETPLDLLADPLIRKTEILKIGENEFEVPYFDIHGHHIWGATAMIVSEFLEIIRKMEQS